MVTFKAWVAWVCVYVCSFMLLFTTFCGYGASCVMLLAITMLIIYDSPNTLKKTKGRYRAVRLCTLFRGSLLGVGILGFP